MLRIEHLSKSYGEKKAVERQTRIRKYADLFELTDDLTKPIAAYSHGVMPIMPGGMGYTVLLFAGFLLLPG